MTKNSDAWMRQIREEAIRDLKDSYSKGTLSLAPLQKDKGNGCKKNVTEALAPLPYVGGDDKPGTTYKK